MASISTPDVKIGIGMGSTWGTARDLTASNVGKIFHASQMTWSMAFGQFDPPDIGFDMFFAAATQLELQVNLNISGSFTMDGAWLQALAQFAGSTTGVPAEITGSQGDYTHTIDMVSSLVGKFVSMGVLIEDDYVVELPSVKITSFQIGGGLNKVPTWSITAIADRVIPTTNSPTNTAAEIAALTVPAYAPFALGATNHYFRMNDQTGGSLSGSDDKNIQSWNLSITRPFQTRFGLRGANSKYTLEPFQLSPTVGEFSIQLTKIDDSEFDTVPVYLAGTEKKGELYMDGTQIGSGVNRSLKIQLPKMSLLSVSGLDVPNNASLMQPTLNFRLLKASAAPSGMTGVTNYARFVAINTRVQSYFN